MQTLRAQIAEAAANDKVKTVILRVESPGGTYVGTPEVREALNALRKKKRVVTSAENEFASGGYWIGSTADEVYASASTMTGSVGVFSVHRNDKEAAEKNGTKFLVMKAGELKASMHPQAEWTKEEIKNQQDRLDFMYDQFVEAVASNRDVSKAEVLERFGKGSTVLGEEAKARGMIDGIATFEEVLARERDRLSSPSSSVSFVQSDKESETMKITARIKAALFSRGLISSVDASDEICEVALNSFASGIGAEIKEDSTEAEVLGVLRKDVSAPAVLDVEDPQVSDEGDSSAASESISRIIGMAEAFPHVTSEMSNEAVILVSEGKASVEDIIDKWTENAASQETDVVITAGDSQTDKFNQGAVAAIISSAGEGFDHMITSEDREMSRSFRNHDIDRIAERWMIQTGRLTRAQTDEMSREDIAEEFLSVGGSSKRRLPEMVADGTINYSGDHPHLVDQLANKVLWQPYPQADYKFRQWCAKLPDLKDFKPRHFVETGIFRGLDLFTEEENVTKELPFESGKKAWYAVDRYRNKAGMTVEMIVNDEVDGFLRQLQSMADLPDKTLNRMCLDMLNVNPQLWDGIPLFDATRGNLIAAGGAPSSAQANKHFIAHQKMKGYDGEEMDIPPTRSLHPVEQREPAMQTFQRAKYDTKVANQDADINTVRDEISPIIDARLDRYDNQAWYTFIKPSMSPVIGYAYMRGYGQGGRREVRYDPESTKRFYYLEARFCASAVDYRGMVKNPGV